MLSHYMNDKGVHMTEEDKGKIDQKSFMQKHKHETCYNVARRATMKTSVPMGTTMTRH